MKTKIERLRALGHKILLLRHEQEMSQQELANKIGITRQTLAKIEKGNGSNVSISTWNSLFDYFGYEIRAEKITIPYSGSIKAGRPAEELYGNYGGWSTKDS